MTKKSVSTHEQVISLRNAKASQSVQVTVREPVPKAVDESIKVARKKLRINTNSNFCFLKDF